MPDHLIYSRETSWATWVTPARWLPVLSSSLKSAREVIDIRATGAGRGQYLTVLGAKPVNGTIEVPWWPVNIGTLLNNIMQTKTTSTHTTDVYHHALLFNDSAEFLGASIQVQRGITPVVTNFLACFAKAFKMSFATKDMAKLSFDLEAKDEAPAGGTWDYDGSASPAAITPTAYPTLIRPFVFSDAVVTFGGTPSIASGKLSIAGGTAHKLFSKLEVSVDLGLGVDGFGLCADPTRQEMPAGQRSIKVTGDRSWSDLLATFYTNYRAGTAMALEIVLTGALIPTTSHAYEAHICLPSLFLTQGNYPDADGAAAPKTQSVEATAQTDATTGVDMGVWIQTSEATI